MVQRSIEEYLALPCTIEVFRDDSDGEIGYVARVVELPGCLTQAETFGELGEMIQDAMHAWIESALEDGQAVPEPQEFDEYSGKFVVRLPKSLHRRLSERASKEGVSLNALVSVALGQYVGMETENKIAQPVG